MGERQLCKLDVAGSIPVTSTIYFKEIIMSHGGKGSSPRPFSVSQKEYETRWDAIFGRDLKEEKKEVDPSITEVYNDERLVSKFDKLQSQEVK